MRHSPVRPERSLAVLKEVYVLLKEEAHWTQHAIARNAAGQPVLPESREAIQWCLIGAVDRVATNLNASDTTEDLGFVCYDIFKLMVRKCKRELATFNDTASHPEILKLLRHALHDLDPAYTIP